MCILALPPPCLPCEQRCTLMSVSSYPPTFFSYTLTVHPRFLLQTPPSPSPKFFLLSAQDSGGRTGCMGRACTSTVTESSGPASSTMASSTTGDRSSTSGDSSAIKMECNQGIGVKLHIPCRSAVDFSAPSFSVWYM